MLASHAETSNGSGTNFSVVALKFQNKSVAYQFELANMHLDYTVDRPNPKDRRVRFLVSHSNRIGNASLNKRMRADYRFMDNTMANHWRIRPGLGLSPPFTFSDHKVIPQVNFETFYNLKTDGVDFHLASVGLAYKLRNSVTVMPGYLKILNPGDSDSEFFTFALSWSLD